MSIELEKAARAAAQRKLNAGIEPRDPVAGGMHFQEQRDTPSWLIFMAILAALLIIALAVSYFSTVPPAHTLMIALGLFWIFSRTKKHWRRNK